MQHGVCGLRWLVILLGPPLAVATQGLENSIFRSRWTFNNGPCDHSFLGTHQALQSGVDGSRPPCNAPSRAICQPQFDLEVASYDFACNKAPCACSQDFCPGWPQSCGAAPAFARHFHARNNAESRVFFWLLKASRDQARREKKSGPCSLRFSVFFDLFSREIGTHNTA